MAGQPRCKQLGLGRFARALAPFERDEFSPGHGDHLQPADGAVNFNGFGEATLANPKRGKGLFSFFQRSWRKVTVGTAAMSSATKPSLRKPVAANKPTVARRSLRRVAVAAPSIPDADGHEALGRAMSGLVKGGLVALLLVTASVSAYLHVMHNQHKSFEQLVQDLISPPDPMFVSRVKGCVAPTIPALGPELEFSTDLPKALLQAVRSSEAATQFVECIVATEPRRFCEPEPRATLAADLKVHAHVRSSLAARVEAARRIKPSASIDQSVVEPIQRETAKALTAATQAIAEADGMVGQVARLARAGLLAPSDFGVFGLGVPTFYADALAGTVTASADCAGYKPG